MANNSIGVLLYDKSYERLKQRLNTIQSPLDIVTWDSQSGLRIPSGRTPSGETDPAKVDIQVGWINSELFASGALDNYLAQLESFAGVAWVQTAHAGLDHPCYARLSARNIRISKSGAQSIPITEYVLAYVLHEFQQISLRESRQAQQQWQSQPQGPPYKGFS